MLLWNPVLPTSVQMCLPKSFVFYIQAKLASYQFSGWPVDHHASSSPSHSGILILLQPFPISFFLTCGIHSYVCGYHYSQQIFLSLCYVSTTVVAIMDFTYFCAFKNPVLSGKTN